MHQCISSTAYTVKILKLMSWSQFNTIMSLNYFWIMICQYKIAAVLKYTIYYVKKHVHLLMCKGHLLTGGTRWMVLNEIKTYCNPTFMTPCFVLQVQRWRRRCVRMRSTLNLCPVWFPALKTVLSVSGLNGPPAPRPAPAKPPRASRWEPEPYWLTMQEKVQKILHGYLHVLISAVQNSLTQ